MERLQYTPGADSDKLRLLIQSRKLSQSCQNNCKDLKNFDDPRRKMIS